MAQAEANRGGKPIMAGGAAGGKKDEKGGAGGNFLSRLFHRRAGEGESKDPEEVSRIMQTQGVLPMLCRENSLMLHSSSKYSRDPSTPRLSTKAQGAPPLRSAQDDNGLKVSRTSES